jgi:hypothetical protein
MSAESSNVMDAMAELGFHMTSAPYFTRPDIEYTVESPPATQGRKD